jgi:hypothetical protein
VQLHGIFYIHGAGHDITLPVAINADHGEYHASATFAVPYVKWGMKNPSTLILRVKDTVGITIRTVAHAGS